MKLNSYAFLVDIMIHVCILTSILSIFFFKIAIKIEEDSLNSLLKGNVSDVKKNITPQEQKVLDTLTADQKQKILNGIDSINFGDSNNKKILNHTVLVVASLLIMTFITILVLILTKRMTIQSFLHILGDNIITFLIIVIIETIFFYQVILEYVPINTSFFLKEAINEINNKI